MAITHEERMARRRARRLDPEYRARENALRRATRAESRGRSRSLIRAIIPDSHGAHIDIAARDACVRDLRALAPHEIVMLGDHLDCGGTFSAHQRTYSNELTESYEEDVRAANEFLDLIQGAAPSAEIHYLEGNHEGHVERWAARLFHRHEDAEGMLQRFGPAARLDLEIRGIRYYRRSEHYQNLSIPGAIKLGKCFFVHGIAHSKHAAAVHLERIGDNIVFGHVHRSMAVIGRTASSPGRGAWCPGTLAKLQPLYKHTMPSDWTHGYAVQFVDPDGRFVHINVPIFGDYTLLLEMINTIGKRGRRAA